MLCGESARAERLGDTAVRVRPSRDTAVTLLCTFGPMRSPQDRLQFVKVVLFQQLVDLVLLLVGVGAAFVPRRYAPRSPTCPTLQCKATQGMHWMYTWYYKCCLSTV